jgi:L-galactose dehydrogenase/L-glyceraldehyde 3-phosphate reductase
MRYRPFGRTGLEVSELVFGGGWVGGILIHQDDDIRRAAIKRALAAGINWIDTAPSYGDGKSEQALGWLLKEVEQQPYVSTKVRLDLGRIDDIRGQVEASIEQSLKRLNADSVVLFQLHNRIAAQTEGDAIAVERVLGKNGVADALDRVREQGLTRFTGITAFGEAAACREVIASGRFDSAQIYYNMLNPSAGRTMPAAWQGHDLGGLIPTCQQHGVAVMNIRVLAAGVLATERRHGRESPMSEAAPIPLEEQRARAVFERLGERYGSRAETALRFALANPAISCVLVGMAELAHLEAALAAAGKGPLPEDALRALGEVYEANFGLG